MKNTINRSKIGLGLLLAGATSALADASKFPITGSVEHIQSEFSNSSYQRGNFFYALPANVKGYSFIEGYRDGSAFVKHNLSRDISNNFGLAGMIRGVDEGLTDAGIGLQAKYSSKSGAYAVGKLVPFWINSEGNRVHDKCIFGFSVGTPIGKTWKAGVFAELNLNAKNGPEWGYGEGFVMKALTGKLSKISIGYNPALKNSKKGSIIPKIEHRFAVQRRF